MSEKQLLLSFKEGDHKAFAILYKQYWRQVYNFCRLYVMEDIAEEVTQEVFIKLWTLRTSVDEDKSFKGFLFVMTRNLVFNQLRKNAHESTFKMLLITAAEESCEMEEEISANDLEEHINRVLKTMPPQRQLVFNLSRKKHLSHKEIGEKLNLSEKTVEQNIRRTLNLLKKQIAFSLITSFMLNLFLK